MQNFKRSVLAAYKNAARRLCSQAEEGHVIIPLSRTQILAGEEATVSCTAHSYFKPVRLILDPVSAMRFSVVDIKIGSQSYYWGSNVYGVSGWLFAPDAPDPKLAWRTIQPGQNVTLVVRNHTLIIDDFYAALIGRGVDTDLSRG